jgi:hypothetical protein
MMNKIISLSRHSYIISLAAFAVGVCVLKYTNEFWSSLYICGVLGTFVFLYVYLNSTRK